MMLFIFEKTVIKKTLNNNGKLLESRRKITIFVEF